MMVKERTMKEITMNAIQKRADQIVVGDVLYASDHNSTGTVRNVTIKHGTVYINAGHFDREVPTHTLLDVDDEPRTFTPRELESFRARNARRHMR